MNKEKILAEIKENTYLNRAGLPVIRLELLETIIAFHEGESYGWLANHIDKAYEQWKAGNNSLKFIEYLHGYIAEGCLISKEDLR